MLKTKQWRWQSLDILSELLSERTDFTGWVGFILVCLVFVRLSARSAKLNQFIDKLVANHQLLAWIALAFLACHGLIAFFQEGSELWEIGTGFCTWLLLLATCLTNLVVAPSQFRSRHVMLVISLAIIALLHIE